MKLIAAWTLVLLAVATAANASQVSPIEKVLQMLGDLQGKIVREGTDAQKVYDEFAEFCEDRSRNVEFEIKTGKSGVQQLEAAIQKEAATSESLTTKIEEVSSDISVDEADLKAATKIREEEKAAFEAEARELTDVIGTLERAISILEKELKGGASMMQLQSASGVAQALSIMVQATSITSSDASKLTALIQNQQQDGSDELGAPAAAVYEGKSGGIVATMQDLFEKAESQLDEARKTESKAANAYAMLAQGLKDEIKYATDDMDQAKKNLAASGEAKATAEGDLSVTSSDLAEDVSTLATLHQDCMKGAEDFQAETKSRGEELTALATAKKVITEATSGAADQSYSFLQVERSSLSSGADLANFEAVRFVRDLARKQKSSALAQLASRMAQVMRSGSKAGEDPFAKVKSLISNMIEKLLKDGQAAATEHAFCEKEMAETEAKKAEKEADIEKLSTNIDQMTAKSAKLKSQVAELQKELAALAQSNAEIDRIRSEEKGIFDANSAEMEKGVNGIQMALKVLNEYYAKESAHGSAGGAGGGIIGLLEVVESDFTKGLAEMVATEQSAVSEYNQLSKANDIEKATKESDVKYKTKESKGLDKNTAETNADRSTVQEELDAVLEYHKGLKGRCIAKAETYGERVKRRDAEISGLKEALSILDGEAVLLQQTAKRALRGHGRV